MFFLQEYQHVHHLWFKKRSFTLVWKPNPLLCSVCCAHLRARADAASINQALLKRSRWKHLSSHDQWNLSPATMCLGSAVCAVWSRRFGAAQTTSTCATASNFYSHTLKKFWSQSRALLYAVYNECHYSLFCVLFYSLICNFINTYFSFLFCSEYR